MYALVEIGAVLFVKLNDTLQLKQTLSASMCTWDLHKIDLTSLLSHTILSQCEKLLFKLKFRVTNSALSLPFATRHMWRITVQMCRLELFPKFLTICFNVYLIQSL